MIDDVGAKMICEAVEKRQNFAKLDLSHNEKLSEGVKAEITKRLETKCPNLELII